MMYQKIKLLNLVSVAVLITIFLTSRSDVSQAFQSPISSPLPTPSSVPPATQDLAESYGIDSEDTAPGGDYYVPPEFQGMVFDTPEEVALLGLKFVDYIAKPRTHCAIADPAELGQDQIVFDSAAGLLVRFGVTYEIFRDGSAHVCWGAPPPLEERGSTEWTDGGFPSE
jgi:hypothetical protein